MGFLKVDGFISFDFKGFRVRLEITYFLRI